MSCSITKVVLTLTVAPSSSSSSEGGWNCRLTTVRAVKLLGRCMAQVGAGVGFLVGAFAGWTDTIVVATEEFVSWSIKAP